MEGTARELEIVKDVSSWCELPRWDFRFAAVELNGDLISELLGAGRGSLKFSTMMASFSAGFIFETLLRPGPGRVKAPWPKL